jgi:hypothetical protein
MSSMNPSEQRVFRRSSFDPDGVLVARKVLVFNGVTYQPGTTLPSASALGLDARHVRKLWEQFAIDTIEREAPPPKPLKATKVK